MMYIEENKSILPHRHPFLLGDRIVSIVPGESMVGIKNVTANEPFFQGHFPSEHVMPGVLIIEALAQVGAIAILKKEENKGKIAYFASINNCKFRRKVIPGDTLTLSIEIVKSRSNFGVGKAIATVDGAVACEAELSFMIG